MTGRKSRRSSTRPRKNTVNHRRVNVAKKEKAVEKKEEVKVASKFGAPPPVVAEEVIKKAK